MTPDIQAAVQQFQLAHGLSSRTASPGPAPSSEINARPRRNACKVVILVAMERERWMNRPRGERHILWVNLTDFTRKDH